MHAEADDADARVVIERVVDAQRHQVGAVDRLRGVARRQVVWIRGLRKGVGNGGERFAGIDQPIFGDEAFVGEQLGGGIDVRRRRVAGFFQLLEMTAVFSGRPGCGRSRSAPA